MRGTTRHRAVLFLYGALANVLVLHAVARKFYDYPDGAFMSSLTMKVATALLGGAFLVWLLSRARPRPQPTHSPPLLQGAGLGSLCGMFATVATTEALLAGGLLRLAAEVVVEAMKEHALHELGGLLLLWGLAAAELQLFVLPAIAYAIPFALLYGAAAGAVVFWRWRNE